MTVYVDDAAIHWRGKDRFHLTADSKDELHDFCRRVGINRCWFHNVPRRWHYDVTGPQRLAAIEAGAVAVTDRQMVYLTEQGRARLPARIEQAKDDPCLQEWLRGIQALIASGSSSQAGSAEAVQLALV